MIDVMDPTSESEVSAAQLREEIGVRRLTEDEWQHFLTELEGVWAGWSSEECWTHFDQTD